jgi:RecA/RadA recombinase
MLRFCILIIQAYQLNISLFHTGGIESMSITEVFGGKSESLRSSAVIQAGAVTGC